MPLPKVTIIILNWNGKEYTIECLESLKHITYPNYKILMIDNGSTDGSVECFRERYPGMEIIENGENLGFAEGNNVGMRQVLETDADYVVLLNNDTIVDPQFLTELIKVAESDQKVGICGAKLPNYYNREIIEAAGKIDVFGYAWSVARGNDAGIVNNIMQVPHVAGACMLVKREVVEKLDPFLDPNYFLYFEETDACWRTRLIGFKIMYVPSAIVLHKSSITTEKHNVNKYYYIEKNRLATLIRNYSTKTLCVLAPLLILNEIIMVLPVLLLGRFGAKFRGWVWLIKNLKHFAATRQKIQHERTVSDEEILTLFSIGWHLEVACLPKIGWYQFNNSVLNGLIYGYCKILRII